MANEITITCDLRAAKSGAAIASGSKTKQLTMAGANMLSATQAIGTSAELISFGDVASPVMVRITNLDDVNYIEIGGDSGLTVFKLKILAGCSNIISPSSGTVYAKANTAGVQILVDAVEP